MAATDEPPIAWPDHPLAASGGEILAARILPLMGHNARDFARAAAVCRGWRAACRAATPTLSLYRETMLPQVEGARSAWSPCGSFVAATVSDPPRLFIWRASTGALVNEWALATPATAVPQDILGRLLVGVRIVFSRDSTRVLTLFRSSNHFAVWSVPDGQLLAVNRGAPLDDNYACADFGVPGSASDGFVGLGSDSKGDIVLWDVSAPTEEGGASRPRLRSRVGLGPADFTSAGFAFSPNGSKFAASWRGVVFVYDVASLTRLGSCILPSKSLKVAWAPDGRHVLVTWGYSACVWDFSRPEAPSVATAYVLPGAFFLFRWSPSGVSYFSTRRLEGVGPITFVQEERRAADGSLVRAVSLGPWESPPRVKMSPDAHALLVAPPWGTPARLVVFE